MTLLADHEIEQLVSDRDAIRPYISDQLNPCSYDVTLGSTLMLEVPRLWKRWTDGRLRNAMTYSDRLLVVDLSAYSKTRPFLIKPGEFVLACTEEVINLPSDVSAQFVLKSSRARSGLEHSEAGWVDAGWCGRITLELSNILQHHNLPLWPGLRIGQLKFIRHSAVRAPYGSTDASHYQNSWGVRPSWQEEPA